MIKKLALQLMLLQQLMGHLAAVENCPDQEFCPSDTRHVMCTNTKGFDKRCGEVYHKIIPVNGGLMNNILLQVNMFRNYVASGLFGMKPASKMPTMMWDTYLATTAERLLRECDVEGKFCSNSKTYNFVPTIQMSGSTKGDESNVGSDIINHFMPNWLMDGFGCHMNKKEQFVSFLEGKCVGHYIPLIQDHGDRMGCAVRISEKEGEQDKVLSMICNLSRASVNGMPHYEINDVPGQYCTSGRNRLYPFLCTPNVQVNYNFVPLTGMDMAVSSEALRNIDISDDADNDNGDFHDDAAAIIENERMRNIIEKLKKG